jgi:Flp pilus assembly pilin Flp
VTAIVYGFMFALIALVIIVGVAAFGAPVKGIVELLSASSLQLKGEVKW